MALGPLASRSGVLRGQVLRCRRQFGIRRRSQASLYCVLGGARVMDVGATSGMSMSSGSRSEYWVSKLLERFSKYRSALYQTYVRVGGAPLDKGRLSACSATSLCVFAFVAVGAGSSGKGQLAASQYSGCLLRQDAIASASLKRSWNEGDR